jgi:hypothetical protein
MVNIHHFSALVRGVRFGIDGTNCHSVSPWRLRAASASRCVANQSIDAVAVGGFEIAETALQIPRFGG